MLRSAGAGAAERFFLEPMQLTDDPLAGPLPDQIRRDADGVGEAERVGAAVALHDDAVEAQEHGTVVAARIEPLANQLQGWLRQHVAELGEQGALERLSQELRVKADGAFDMKTYVEGDGAPPGDYRVSVTVFAGGRPKGPPKDQPLGEEAPQNYVAVPKPIADKFANADSSGLKITVQEGENTLDPIDLGAAKERTQPQW